nr:MAVS [Bostrychus sinensis]
MSYASDQLYRGYLRKNMARIVSTVKPREIVVHLPCLTDHDRETIEAKREISGSFNAMVLLLDCLKRRENWPEQFIAALEACEHPAMAAEIQAEYDALRGINNNPHPPPPPTPPSVSVVTAHVHPAPSAQHQPDPGAAASPQPAQDVPSEGVTPQALPIQESTASSPSKPAVSVVVVTTPPEPPQTLLVTPPPSPEMLRGSASPSTPPEPVEFITHREPEENLEPGHQVQDVPNETNIIQQEAEEHSEVPAAPEPFEPKEEPCEVGDSFQTATIVDQPAPTTAILDQPVPTPTTVKPIPDEPEPATILVKDPTHSTTIHDQAALTTTIVDYPILTTSVVEEPSRSPSPPMTSLDDPILTPEKPPVQETSPPEEEVPAVVPELKETSEPLDTQVVEIVQHIEVPSKPPAAVENDDALSDEENVSVEGSQSEEEDTCFSKPGVLLSVEPPNLDTTIFPPSPEPAPYSGNSARLELSEAEKSSCQGNGFDHSKPEGGLSESPTPSLDTEDVCENVGRVVEEPSILDQAIQTPLVQDSGEPDKEITSVPLNTATTLISDPSSSPDMKDISESPAPSLEIEDVQKNIGNVAEEPCILIQETQTPAKEITSTTTTLISDTFSNPNMEDISESPASSLGIADVPENVGHVAQEPSILSQEIQTAPLQVNGEPAKEVTPVLPTSDPSSNDNHQLNELPTNPYLPPSPATSLISDTSSSPYVEDIAGSFPPSLDMEDVRENIVHVAEQPSILNQEVQSPLLQVNGEPAKEVTPVLPTSTTTLISDPSSNDNHQLNEPPTNPYLPDSGEKTNRLNTKYILTAAGVGACALLIAWRFKH